MTSSRNNHIGLRASMNNSGGLANIEQLQGETLKSQIGHVKHAIRTRLERTITTAPDLALHAPGEFISDHIRRTRRHYELTELLWVRRHLDFSRFVDIGANIGNHCNFFAKYGAIGWAFEPSRRNYALLIRNAPTFQCYQVALADTDGTCEFITFDSCMGNSYVKSVFGDVIQNWGEGAQSENVSRKPLDSFAIDRPTLIKIDVEGAELQTLRGAQETLRRYKPALWIEIHTDETLASANFPYRRSDIYSELEKLGYVHKASLGKTNHIFS